MVRRCIKYDAAIHRSAVWIDRHIWQEFTGVLTLMVPQRDCSCRRRLVLLSKLCVL